MKRVKKKNLLTVIFSRTTILILMLGLNIAFLYGIFRVLNNYVASGLYMLLSFVEVVYILNRGGSSVFKISWIMSIILLPVFGGLFYLFVRLQNRSYQKKRAIDRNADAACDDSVLLPADLPAEAAGEIGGLLAYLGGKCGFPAYSGTEVMFYPQGEAFLRALIMALEQAEKSIYLEFFIISEGEIWDEILGVLKAKAEAGVDVRLIFDGMNTISSLPFHYERTLRGMGIKCCVFSKVIPLLVTRQNNRDHRKICVIDGRTAFTGGVNLADEYADLIRRYGVWKDSGIRLKGPAVVSMRDMFLDMWNLLCPEDEKLRPEAIGGPPPREAGGCVIPYCDSPLDEEPVGENVYFDILNTAKSYVYFMTPYLVLTDQMIAALKFASARGVDVRLVLPGIPDKRYAWWLAHTYYEELIGAGVEIYEYTPGFVHAKECISDGKKGVSGTINLDFRSLYLNYENAVVFYDVPAVREMEEDFRALLHDCRKIDPEALAQFSRVKLFIGKLIRLLAPLF